MARNKRGREMAAGYKTKEDVQLAKTTGAYEVEIAENIHESSSTKETKASHKAREERKARKARRRATRARAKVASSSTSQKEDRRYNILAQYHQLNYGAVQAALKELNVKPTVINNTRLWINNVSKEEYEKIRDALIQCHFETKQHKQYKVRVAGYRHIEFVEKKKKEKKPTNNKPDVALAAKKKRKAAKLKVANNRGRHLTGRKANKSKHSPGTKDTSTYKKKLLLNAKKACELLKQKDKDREAQAKSRASKPISKHKTGKADKQLSIAA